jgi:hypothetical protein
MSANSLSLWNPKVRYRLHKSPPLDPILKQPNTVRSIDAYLPEVHLDVLPHLRLGLPSGLFFGPPNQNSVNISPLPHACYMSRPPHPP